MSRRKSHKYYYHKNIRNDIEWYRKRAEALEKISSVAHKYIETVYEEQWLDNAWGFNIYAYEGVYRMTIHMEVRLPHSKSLILAIDEKMKKLGFEQLSRHDNEKKLELKVVYELKQIPECDFPVELDFAFIFDGSTAGSTCAMMPLRFETKTVATVFEKVCSEEHPEMFDSEGKLIPQNHPLYVAPPEGAQV